MRVTDLRVDGFGIWTQLELGGLADRVTVIYGANEAGKTTLMQFMRSVLYGFSAERRARYLPPVHGGSVGGGLRLENNLQPLSIERHLWNFGSRDEREKLELWAADGAALAPAVLDQLLAGVDEPTFNNVFAVGLRELQELGTLDDTDAAELLYKLTTGLDRVSLLDVMRQLESASRELLDPEGSDGVVWGLWERRRQLRSRVDELSDNGRQWLELESLREQLTGETGQLRQAIDELTYSSQIVQAALQTRELWGQQAALQRQRELLGPVADIPEGSLEKLERWQETIGERQRQLELLKRRRREIRQEISLLPLNPRLWSQAARIEALTELAPWIVSLQTQVEQLRGEVQGLEARLAHSTTPLGPPEEAVSAERTPEISRRAAGLLRPPARALRDETQRLKQAQDELEAARTQCDDLVVELETTLLDRGHEDLGSAVEQTGSDVSLLRRRVQLDQRREELAKRRETLQHEHRELMDEQVLSVRALAWLGVPFVVGVMLLLGGLVWSRAASLGWPVALLGLAGWGVAVIAKISLERAAARDLEQCEKQLELLNGQLDQLEHDIEQVDQQLPAGSGNPASRLSVSEKELATLEELLPLEANLQTARQRVQAAQRRVDQLTESVKELRGRWRSSLRRANLPETLSPNAVRQLAESNEHTLQARRQLEMRRAELKSREQELASLAARVQQIAEDVELKYTIHDPQQLLNHLSVAISEQRSLFERKKKLRQEERKIQREGAELVTQLREARTRRRALLARSGVESEEELRRIAAQAAQHRALEEEIALVQEQMQLAVGDRFPFALVERELIDHGKEALEKRHAALRGQIQQRQADLASLHQQQGALVQQSKTLLSDRRLAEAKLELGCVEQKLQEAVQRWRVLAITAHLLETVRQIYEAQRQPQTLIDASRFFSALTEGQYVRIWTPLTDMSLRVDMADGTSLPLDVLSCGTREAVFLSLRLALVADFARRGVVLPLVLDDVLVNFDQLRAGAAARVLCQFAQQGHQVLMFTCHQHIVQLFQALHASIRCLHADGVVEVAVLEAQEQPAEIVAELEEEPEELPEMWELVEEEQEYDPEECVFEEELQFAEEADPPAPPVDDDREYQLREAETVLAHDAFGELLAAQAAAEEEIPADQDHGHVFALSEPVVYTPPSYEFEIDDDQDEEPVEEVSQEEEPAEEDDTPAPVQAAAEPRRQRFTWESPERWWESSRDDEAAA